MTTDDSLNLYAAGYDFSGNFIGNLKVNWTLTGSLVGEPLSENRHSNKPEHERG